MKILVRPEHTLIRPISASQSEFSSEQRKYDRKSIGIIEQMGHTITMKKAAIFHKGDTVVYDDSNSVDFDSEGISYSIIKNEAIVGVFQKGEKDGEA